MSCKCIFNLIFIDHAATCSGESMIEAWLCANWKAECRMKQMEHSGKAQVENADSTYPVMTFNLRIPMQWKPCQSFQSQSPNDMMWTMETLKRISEPKPCNIFNLRIPVQWSGKCNIEESFRTISVDEIRALKRISEQSGRVKSRSRIEKIEDKDCLRLPTA